MAKLNFKMGAYTGKRGDLRPMIELKHASGARLRFLAHKGKENVTTVFIKADGPVSTSYRTRAEAESLYEKAARKGFRISKNVKGMN